MIERKLLNKKGTALLLALLILAVVFVIAMGVSEIIIVQVKISERVEDSVSSFYAADSGVECQLYKVFKENTTSTDQCLSLLGNTAFNDENIFVSDLKFISTSTINSVGEAYSVKRGIRVEW